MDETSTDFAERAIPYINRGIDFLSDTLISYKDPLFLIEVMIAPNLPVPSDFVQFSPANGYPVTISSNGGTPIFYTTGGNTVKVKYWSRKPHVTDPSQVLPFPDCYCTILVQIVSLFVLNRNEAGITSDSGLLAQILAALKAAKA
jgi:hypothetical protein